MASDYSEKLKDPRLQKKRLQILERDNWTCQTVAWNEAMALRFGIHIGETCPVKCLYCGLKGYLHWINRGNLRLSWHFHFEHILPKALGGTDSPENIAISCAHCNWSKHHDKELPKTLGIDMAKWI